MKNEREFLFVSYDLNHPSMNHPLFTNREFLNERVDDSIYYY